MNINKVYALVDYMEANHNFDEISKAYREILYEKYSEMKEYQQIHAYQLTRDMIDILQQMIDGKIFDEEYLKDTIKW